MTRWAVLPLALQPQGGGERDREDDRTRASDRPTLNNPSLGTLLACHQGGPFTAGPRPSLDIRHSADKRVTRALGSLLSSCRPEEWYADFSARILSWNRGFPIGSDLQPGEPCYEVPLGAGVMPLCSLAVRMQLAWRIARLTDTEHIPSG